MPNPALAPRTLSRTREYPAYQFHAYMRLNDRPAEDCFKYGVLTVLKWLRTRIEKSGAELPQALKAPEPEAYADASMKGFMTCHETSGFKIDITPLPEHGAWAITLSEPDTGTNDRPAVNGRSFTTYIGFRQTDEPWVELGIRIDVTDPPEAEEEVPYAFRPLFVRWFFENPELELFEGCPLPYQKSTIISNKAGMKSLGKLISDRDNQLPILIFTYAEEKPEPKPLNKITLDTTPVAPHFSRRFAMDAAPPVPIQLLDRNRPRKQISPAKVGPTATQTEPKYFLPFKPDAVAERLFAYAHVFTVNAEMTNELRRTIKSCGKELVSLQPGDVVRIDARPFGNNVRQLKYADDPKDFDHKQELICQTLRTSGKHKSFDFGNVLFEESVRSAKRDAEIEAIRKNARISADEKLEEILDQCYMLHQEGLEKDAHIARLQEQILEEYNRGYQIGQQEKEEANLTEMLWHEELSDKAEKRAAEAEQHRMTLEAEAARGRDLQAIVDAVQSKVPKMPETAEDVALFFREVFKDRIGFTERGLRSLSSCEMRPALFWECLYAMATVLVDLYRDGTSDIDSVFRDRTGFEMASTEGSQTRKDPKMMALRTDEWNGQEINIEAHVKIRDTRASIQNQRIHFQFVRDANKLVIGYVGDHLESASSQYFH